MGAKMTEKPKEVKLEPKTDYLVKAPDGTWRKTNKPPKGAK